LAGLAGIGIGIIIVAIPGDFSFGDDMAAEDDGFIVAPFDVMKQAVEVEPGIGR